MLKNLFTFIFRFRVFLAVALCFGAVDFVCAHSRRMGNAFWHYSHVGFDNPLQLNIKLRNARHEPGTRLVVVVGSSVARESVDEQALAKILGPDVRMLNLGFFHASPVDIWMISRRILALEPDLILYPLMPGDLYRRYNFGITMRYYFSPKILSLAGPGGVMENWRDFFYAGFSGASFLFRYRDSLSSVLLRFGREKLGIEHWPGPVKYRFSDVQEYLPTLDENLSLFGELPIRDDGLVNAGMNALMDDFKAHSIPVAMILAPFHPKLETELMRLKKEDILDWYHHGFSKQFPAWAARADGRLFFPPRSIFPNRFFADYLHLNALGRARFTEWTGKEILKSGLKF